MATEEEENKGIPWWGIFLIGLGVFLGLYVLNQIFKVLLFRHLKKKYMPVNSPYVGFNK